MDEKGQDKLLSAKGGFKIEVGERVLITGGVATVFISESLTEEAGEKTLRSNMKRLRITRIRRKMIVGCK